MFQGNDKADYDNIYTKLKDEEESSTPVASDKNYLDILRNSKYSIAFSIVAVATLVIIICLYVIPSSSSSISCESRDISCIDQSNAKNMYTANGTYIHRIVLFGDSLIQIPTTDLKLASNLYNRFQKRFPSIEFDLVSSGSGGDMIANLRDRIYTDCINYQPESVVMYWDSDVSENNNISYLSSKEGINKYKENLYDVIEILLAKNVINLAIAGPNLLGELPYGENIEEGKDEILNLYRDINRNTTVLYNISYIDIRKTFMDVDHEKHWSHEYGYLTVDNEHPSYTGEHYEEETWYSRLT